LRFADAEKAPAMRRALGVSGTELRRISTDDTGDATREAVAVGGAVYAPGQKGHGGAWKDGPLDAECVIAHPCTP
jgi:hypothetical protein